MSGLVNIIFWSIRIDPGLQFLTQISATSINEKGENAKILAGKGIKVIQCDVSKDADIENLIEIVEERG